MSQEAKPDDISKKMVVYQIPGVDDVAIRRDAEYRVTDEGVLTMDFYYPPDSKSGARIPAVVFVSGYSDLTFEAMFGCKLKDIGQYLSWGQLVAASGLVAITYTTRQPIADIHAVLQYVRQNAASLGIDENRIGVWACSANVPNALSVLMEEANDYLKCAVLYYGLMLDLDGSTSVAEAAKTVGFVNPCAGKSVDDLRQDVPLLIVRAGQDETLHLNETIDRFLAQALICNLPIIFTNYSNAPHAFDILQDTELSREIIKQTLEFMRFHLLA